MNTDEEIDLRGVGERVDAVRRSLGMSGRAFADALGVATGNVSMVLRGQVRPSWELLTALARRTGTSLDWLLTGQGSPKLGAEAPEPPRARVTLVTDVEIRTIADAISRTPALMEVLRETDGVVGAPVPHQEREAHDLVHAIYNEGDPSKVGRMEGMLRALAPDRSERSAAKTA